MRLSEAIRLGAMMRPQAYGKTMSEDGATCALGAALDAIGKLDKSGCEVDQASIAMWPFLTRNCTYACPVGNCVYGKDSLLPSNEMGVIIVHLNDEHKWTREQIADWVETVEPVEVSGEKEERYNLQLSRQHDQAQVSDRIE